MIKKILRHMNFATISNTRMVCRYLNYAAYGLLNSEFVWLRCFMQQRAAVTRSRELDMIKTVNMRLTLLQMTQGKHIQRKCCCFFPGEILDEVHRIL
ncbi:hypothetical protein MRX96_058428 [Rhipicephalus microplus]